MHKLSTTLKRTGTAIPRETTVGQIAANTLASLIHAGIEPAEAQIETQLILGHCLKLDYAQQLTHAAQSILAVDRLQIENTCQRRTKERLPLQYCLGYADFWGMKFAINPGVFIPRVDTEALVNQAVRTMRAGSAKLAVEIGTGSGAIAVALAHELPNLSIVAIDVCDQALKTACRNAAKYDVARQIKFIRGDWKSVFENYLGRSNSAKLFSEPFLLNEIDAVISNPPYLNEAQRLSLPPEIIQHEPQAALFGQGEDGLDFYRELASFGAEHFKSGTQVFLEIGDEQAERTTAIFRKADWEAVECHADLNGLPRVLTARTSLR